MTNGSTHKAAQVKAAGVKRQRTCIACGNQSGKTDLMRIVRSPQGEVDFDSTGRAAGRGAYVCSMDCFEAARASRRFDRSLKTNVSDQDYERIAAQLAQALEKRRQ